MAPTPTTSADLETLVAEQAQQFPHWEKTKDLVDQCIDMMLNYRQSGHPGGSRSKVHAMRGDAARRAAMRWDSAAPGEALRRPVRARGRTRTPLLYCGPRRC